METRKIPAILTLLGCAVAAISMYIDGYTLLEMAKALLFVLFIFLILGIIIKIIIDKNIPPIEEEEQVDDEGAVIEKTSEDEEEDGTVVTEKAEEGTADSE